MKDLSRRDFFALGAAAGLVARPSTLAQFAVERAPREMCVFSKPLQHLGFKELAAEVSRMGFSGIEAPVRPGGHIEPERVPEELPLLIDALRERGLAMTVLTSEINRADQDHARTTLETAAKLGVRRYRLKYYRYDLSKPVIPQLDNFRRMLEELVALNAELGIKGIYQNHSGGNYVGAPIWDLHELIEGLSNEHIGVAYDIGHARVEGGMCWRIQHNLIRPRIDTLYIKDFIWSGKKRVNVPLGEGNLDRKIFRSLLSADFRGPISLHMEHVDHRKPELAKQRVAAIEADQAFMQRWLKK